MELGSCLDIGRRIVGVTLVGSRLWNQAREDSDYDLFVIFTDSLKDVLFEGPSMKSIVRKCEYHGKTYDVQAHEVSKVSKYLSKQNVNFIVGITGFPLVRAPILDKLYLWTMKNRSKAIYNSIRGMLAGNYKKILEGKIKDPHKIVLKLRRYYLLGVAWLNGEFTGREWYKEIKIEDRPYNVPEMIESLDEAYRRSKLPPEVPLEGLEELKNLIARERLSDYIKELSSSMQPHRHRHKDEVFTLERTSRLSQG